MRITSRDVFSYAGGFHITASELSRRGLYEYTYGGGAFGSGFNPLERTSGLFVNVA